MMYEESEEYKIQVTIFLMVEYANAERQVWFAVYSNTKRQFSVGSFKDNEHYSSMESLLLQINPKEKLSVFQVHVIAPPIKSQRKKIAEKISQYQSEISQSKLGNGEIHLALKFLLRKDLNYYSKEMENKKMMMALEKLLEVLGLERDNSNRAQFHLRLNNMKMCMMLDQATINALHIFSKESDKNPVLNSTLFEIFNKCKTNFGTRCLKRWMKQPLQTKIQLNIRLNKVEYFISNPTVKNLIQNQLKKLPDLDRLYYVFYKVAAGKKMRCEVSDLIKIYRVIESLKELLVGLESRSTSDEIIENIYGQIKKNVDIINTICRMIEKGIDMTGTKDKSFFVKPETQPSLDALMRQINEIQKDISSELAKVSRHLNLEVEKSPSNTYKYVFEANKKLAINKIKQTPGYKYLTARATRLTFVTDNLVRLCSRLNAVEEEYKDEQQTILKKMFDIVAGYYPIMEKLSLILSELDVLTTFSSIVNTAGGAWCRPLYGEELVGKRMRHPCVKDCVANDCVMSSEKTIILTGPNMGGKSTYIRTIGVCSYLAHLGCYVPALEFETPIIDAIITRVGASDLQVRGISTFMSEMLESSCMLQLATANSLVLIDQLGRGTSVCDGFGIAWAICEYLHKNVNPFCLFATHFHEMTRMADEIDGVKNMFTSCSVVNGKLNLEFKVEDGRMQKSFGIEVTKMLGFPPEVIENAKKYLSHYQLNESEDEEISKYSEDLKDQAIKLYEQCQNQVRLSCNQDKKKHIEQHFQAEIKGILRKS